MSANSAIFNPTESTSAATGDGFSCPRLTTTGRLAITFGPNDKGMMVYDTTLNNLFIWNGTAWESVPASGDAGANGSVQYNDNGVVSGAPNFIYDKATSAVSITGDLTVDTSTLKVDSANNRVGIGTASPTAGMALDIVSATSNNFVRFTDGVNATGYLGVRAANGAVYLHANNNIVSLSCSTSNTTPTEQLRITNPGVFEFLDGAGGTRMTLNSTGLGIGASPASYGGTFRTLAVNATDAGILDLMSNSVSQFRIFGNGSENRLGGITNVPLTFHTNNSEKMRIDSSGNVGIGVTPSAWGSTYRALQIGLGTSLTGITNDVDVNLVNNARFDGTNWKYTNSSPAERYRTASGTHYWYNAASGTAGNNITWAQAMTLDASGRLILLASTTTPATLATNGELTFTATSNTNLRFSYRGSDGVTRIADLTLA